MNPSANSPNQYFSFSRFGRLFARHTAEHLPGYLMAAAVLGGLLLLLMGMAAYFANDALSTDMQAVFFVLFLMLAGTMFTSNVFAQFGDKRQATVALLLPASQLEKYLVAWLYSLPLFVLGFTAVFYLVDAAVLYAAAPAGAKPELLNLAADWPQTGNMLWKLAFLHGLWLWGAIHFEKAHFIKTGFAAFLGLAVACALNYQVLAWLLDVKLSFSPPFTGIMFYESEQRYGLEVPKAQAAWLGWLPLLLAGLLWLAAYYRVTEKQL